MTQLSPDGGALSPPSTLSRQAPTGPSSAHPASPHAFNDQMLLTPQCRATGGFSLEVEATLKQRREHHLALGDAHRDADGRVRYHRNLLATQERRELARAGGELAAMPTVPFRMPAPDKTIRSMVPWRPVIERSLGREVVGLVTDGGISWQIGRDRGGSL